MHAMPRFRNLLAGLAGAVAIVSSGCVMHAYEIDTTDARDYTWNGKVRIIELTEPEIGPFLTITTNSRIIRVELLGDTQRDVVILPGEEPGDLPLAFVQHSGRPPDQILGLARVRFGPRFGPANMPDRADSSFSERDVEVALQRRDHFANQEFDQMSAIDVLKFSGHAATSVESTYNLSDGIVVRASLTGWDRRILSVTIEDAEGGILHRYDSQELPVVELDTDGVS